MAWRRKRKGGISPDYCEPNGRLQRPTLAQIAAAERENRMKETALVRRQPHRRDLPKPDDQRATEPWGLFCIGLLDDMEGGADMQRAGEEYARQWRSWRLAVGLPCPFGKSSDGIATGCDARDPDSLWRKIKLAQSAMRDASKAGALAVDEMCGENRPVPHALWGKAALALAALARHLGVTASGTIAPIQGVRMTDSYFYYGPDPQVPD